MAVVGKMLEDRKKKATFIVKKNHDDIYTIVSILYLLKSIIYKIQLKCTVVSFILQSGTIESEGVNVKPLPDHLNEHYNRLKTFAEEPKYFNNATLCEYSKPFHHGIYKKTKIADNPEYFDLSK